MQRDVFLGVLDSGRGGAHAQDTVETALNRPRTDRIPSCERLILTFLLKNQRWRPLLFAWQTSALDQSKTATMAEGDPWSRSEVEAIVADYRHMLVMELNGQSDHNKSAHRRAKKL